MSQHLQQHLQRLDRAEAKPLLREIGRGIEKESLRVTPEGKLARTPHPVGLGSALAHGSITTDYSEALLEFITPVSHSIEDSLAELENIHRYTYGEIGDEMLWAASMPCIVSGDAGIPVAEYGSSNVARMKTIYRYGLGHRYGRLMQAIAGIHYNFSMPHAFWEQEWEALGRPGKLKHHITERYLDLIRHFRRYSWLLIYLYGASPAVCASFLRGRDSHCLQPFDEHSNSLYMPHATSLRMGDLGYNSEAQKGLNVCYNCLDSYVETLREAIMQPHPAYKAIPHGENGEYQQLKDSLLQIENEFYSPIRPNRVTHSGETPLAALRRGGVEYVEVRCVDVSPFHAVGLDAQQIRFMDTFLLYCLFSESPDCDDHDQAMQAANLEAVVNRGRKPGLMLQTAEGSQSLQDWATGLLSAMAPIARMLDETHETDSYSGALQIQQAKVDDPELTPSARVLREMREQQVPFFRLAMNYSERWAEQFRSEAAPAAVTRRLREEAERSLQAQAEIEAADDLSFEQYLANFYAQYAAV